MTAKKNVVHTRRLARSGCPCSPGRACPPTGRRWMHSAPSLTFGNHSSIVLFHCPALPHGCRPHGCFHPWSRVRPARSEKAPRGCKGSTRRAAAAPSPASPTCARQAAHQCFAAPRLQGGGLEEIFASHQSPRVSERDFHAFLHSRQRDGLPKVPAKTRGSLRHVSPNPAIPIRESLLLIELLFPDTKLELCMTITTDQSHICKLFM